MYRYIINSEFEMGEILYLKTDVDQRPRQMVAVMKDVGETLLYKLQAGAFSDWHYGIEISRNKDILLSTTN